jgi:hypothetical protein
MPYHVRNEGKGSKPYSIYNSETGKKVGSSDSAEKAHASVRARMANEFGAEHSGGGAEPTKRDSSGKSKMPGKAATYGDGSNEGQGGY